MNVSGIIFIGLGILSVFLGITGLSNKSRKGQRMVRLLGEAGTKIFYVVLGIVLIVGAFFI